MPDLKKFAVFGREGRLGTLAAPARFLDNRSEKTIQLEKGGEISVPAASLEVQPDGTFFLREPPQAVQQPARQSAPQPVQENVAAGQNGTAPSAHGEAANKDFYQEGYSIERVKVDRLITEPVSQRQEGDTLVLPVIEEVLVMEKRLMLREEIRITRRRDPVKEVRTIDSTLQ